MKNTNEALTNLREQMHVCRECTYMDSAYDCGGGEFALDAMKQFFRDWTLSASSCERGGPGRLTFFKKADKTREMICRLIGASDPQCVCFTRNTNEGINHVLLGFDDFRPGDNIVTTEIDHPSVLMPCLKAAELRNIEVKTVPGEHPVPSAIEALCDEHTRIVAVSHVQSSNGFKIDLEELGAFCRSHNIYLVVDGIQSAGLSVIECEKWGVSALSAGSYKGLLGGESCAFLWCCPDLLEHINPVYTAAGFGVTVDRSGEKMKLKVTSPRSARKLENSSLDTPGIYMLNAGIGKILEIGTEAIENHIRSLYDELYEGLEALGIRPVTPKEKNMSCASIAFDLPDKQDFYEKMRAQNVAMTCSRFLRLSIGAYTTHEDIKATLRAAETAVRR